MNTKRLFISLVGLIGLLVSGCAAPAPATPSATIVPTFIVTETPSITPTFTPRPTAKPADRFLGDWSGTMSFSDDPNHKEDIEFVIFDNCKPGSPCGDFINNTLFCTAAIEVIDIKDNVFEYKFGVTSTNGDQCRDSGGGTLIWQADGTLLWEHTNTAGISATGILTRIN